MWQARFDEAERELKLAQLLDPLYPLVATSLMGQLLAMFEETIQRLWSNAARRWRSIPTTGPPTAYVSATVYDRMGNHGQALKAFEKGVAIEPGPISIAFLG